MDSHRRPRTAATFAISGYFAARPWSPQSSDTSPRIGNSSARPQASAGATPPSTVHLQRRMPEHAGIAPFAGADLPAWVESAPRTGAGLTAADMGPPEWSGNQDGREHSCTAENHDRPPGRAKAGSTRFLRSFFSNEFQSCNSDEVTVMAHERYAVPKSRCRDPRIRPA
jgi:hypothetical protein